jgi:hypothetical protein
VESATSEVSWEALEEGEARPTLWVPDHAVCILPPPPTLFCVHVLLNRQKFFFL